MKKSRIVDDQKEKIKILEAKLVNWTDTSIEGLQRRTIIQSDVALTKRIIDQDLMRISRYTLINDRV